MTLPENLLLHVDEAIAVVNKPAGLLTLPDGYDPAKPHLRALLEPHLGRLWIVHRLDRRTSGVLVLARTAEAHRHLNTQFERHQVRKVYHALVVGDPPWERRRINLPLRTNVGRRHRTVVDRQRGKPAQTEVRVLRRFGNFALVEAVPRTGRTHQIRAHLTAIGFPLVGDDLYGDPQHPVQGMLDRPALHALSLTFAHPASGETVTFEAPYPEDFQRLLA